jgi:LCP family protein required for cell wall assembly
LLLIIVLLATYFFIQVQRNGGGFSGFVTTVIGSSKDEISNLDDIYALCIGSSLGMTDTIMVAKYSPRTQTAALLSIPRDTFVGSSQATATPYDKINAKYQEGPQRTLDYVNQLTGLNIKYFITVDTKALRDVVDALGGIYFDVPIDMDYDDDIQDLHIHLTHGMQRIDGEKAEQLLRFRHNNDGTSYPSEYGDNDYGRMKTQRAFIKEIVKQTLDIKNLPKMKKLLDSIYANIITNVERETIMAYIPYIFEFNTDNIDTQQLPGVSEKANEVWFYFHDKDKTQKLIEVMDKRLNGSDVIIPENLIVNGNKSSVIDETEDSENVVNETSNSIQGDNTTNESKNSNIFTNSIDKVKNKIKK